MEKKYKRALTTGLACALVATVSASGAFANEKSECPNKDKAKTSVEALVGAGGVKDVVSIKAMPQFNKELCEVVVEFAPGRGGSRYGVMYLNSGGDHVIVGQLLQSETKENLTRKTMDEYLKWTQESIEEAKKVAFATLGDGKEEIIFVTDPDCPFCKMSLPVVEEVSKRGVKVHVLLVPLHGEKTEKKAKGLICEKKSVSDIHTYSPADDFKSCQEADEKVEKAKQIFFENSVGGTPAFVYTKTGKMHLGAIKDASDLEKAFGIKLEPKKEAQDDKGTVKEDKKPEAAPSAKDAKKSDSDVKSEKDVKKDDKEGKDKTTQKK